jgi:uncharacterized membrane protein
VGTLALAVAAASALAGCSTSYMVIDAMPAAVGGLPEKTPERPETPPAYPAVHDMPGTRADTPLSEAERKRLREELAATRERNAKRGAEATRETTGGGEPATGTARNP